MTFEAWKRLVDERMFAEVGVSSDDIEDWSYHAEWEDGVNPNDTALEALENAGYDMGDY